MLVILILLQSCSSEHWWFGYTYETDGYTNKSATIVKINYPSEKVVIPSTIFFHKVNAEADMLQDTICGEQKGKECLRITI